MPTEIERKFLLRNDSWRRSAVSCSLLRQAYAHFQGNPHLTLRIRHRVSTRSPGFTGDRNFTLFSPV